MHIRRHCNCVTMNNCKLQKTKKLGKFLTTFFKPKKSLKYVLIRYIEIVQLMKQELLIFQKCLRSKECMLLLNAKSS